MYHFPYFKEKNSQKVLQLIADYPLGFLTGSFLNGKQVATQVPMLIEEKNGELFLQCHIMKNTDHHKAFYENNEVLAVFSGPQAYVSSSWYSHPAIGSTWNFMSVHVNGKVRFMEDEELVAFMKKLTLKFENNNEQSPVTYDNLPESFINSYMPGIVGLEIKADGIDNVFKLSQNRDYDSYCNIIAQLKKGDSNSKLVAEEMVKRSNELFNK